MTPRRAGFGHHFHGFVSADLFVLLADYLKLLCVEIIEIHDGVLCFARHPQKFVDFDAQNVVVSILSMLNYEYHEEGDDGSGGIDDQLPSVVVVKPWASAGPRQDSGNREHKGAWLAGHERQALGEFAEIHDLLTCNC